MKDFVPFYDWAIENGYKKGLTIDRRDNGGDYTPQNCRFVTNAVNSQNSRNAKLNWGYVRQIRWFKEFHPDVGKRTLASIYHVCPETIRDVLNYKTWKE